MNLYLDDNMANGQLANMLVKAGHSAILPTDAGLAGKPDPIHFEYAIRQQKIILTRDQGDFEDLHSLILTAGGSHPGHLIVRDEKAAAKKMQPKHIAAAVNKLAKSGVLCIDSLIVLNHWR